MEYARFWCMPNHKTFEMKPVKRLLKNVCVEPVIDLFPYPYQRDALEYAKSLPDNCAKTVLFDPPYSPRQLKEMYESKGLALTQELAQSYWKMLKHEIARILEPGGICVKFGWNSGRIYKNFEIKEIILLCHGKEHNDTIITVQQKQGGLSPYISR